MQELFVRVIVFFPLGFWSRLDFLLTYSRQVRHHIAAADAAANLWPRWPDEVNAGRWVHWPTLPTTAFELAAKTVCVSAVLWESDGKVDLSTGDVVCFLSFCVFLFGRRDRSGLEM